MTDVNKSNTRRISSVEDALPLYAPPPAAFTGKMGAEVEMPLYRRGDAKPAIPTAREMEAMQDVLKKQGFDAQLEAAGVLEYASPAVPVSAAAELVARVNADVKAFERVAAEAGYVRAPFSVLPTTTRAEAFGNMVSRERLQASLGAMPALFPEETLNLPLLTTGVQTSFSPKDSDEMFRMAYRAYALNPLIIAALNSSAGFAENDPARRDVHVRSKLYENYRAAGGIAESFLDAENGGELVRNHIVSVFKNPMHFAYDAQGNIVRSTAEDIITFEKLAERGLNTQANYELAESFLYNDVKICNLRVGDDVVGKRIEVRPADSGLHQAASLILLTAALVPDGPAAEAFERVLKDYGFTGSPKRDAELFIASRRAAVEHGGKFMDVPFGTGSLRDFAVDVAGIIVPFYDGKGLGPELSRLTDILLTGECDAKAFARAMPELKDVTAALQKAGEGVNPRKAPAPSGRGLG